MQLFVQMSDSTVEPFFSEQHSVFQQMVLLVTTRNVIAVNHSMWTNE